MKILSGYRRKKNAPGVPAELSDKIEGLYSDGVKRAVFDLDNTILNGDIGDALFCRLKELEKKEKIKADGTLIGLTWDEYRGLISRGEKESAYRRVVECMDNIPVKLIADLTRALMNSDFRSLEHSGEQITIPHVDQGMMVLLALLKKEKFEIKVISASNSISVNVIVEEYIGLEKGSAFGIETKVINNSSSEILLTEKLKEPAPVNEGKAELYRNVFGTERPLLTAGDSELDFPMLDLVSDGGIVLWRGEEGHLFEKLRILIGDRASVISLRNIGFGPGISE